MKLSVEPQPLYFMHVPKTGGTTLGQWLRTGYGRRRYIELDLAQLGQNTAADLQRYRCYHSWHHGRSLYDLLRRPDLPVATILRDPVERTVSDFHFRLQSVEQSPAGFTPEYLALVRPLLGRDIQQSMASDLVTRGLRNGQTRLLGGRVDYTPFLKGGARASMPVVRPYDMPRLVDPDDAPQLLRNARAWLAEMAVVGLTERYAETLLLLADQAGLPAHTDLPRAKVNPRRTSAAMRYRDHLPPAVVAELEEINTADRELYAYGCELFAQQWARYQARAQRTYSIAAHARHALRAARQAVGRALAPQPTPR